MTAYGPDATMRPILCQAPRCRGDHDPRRVDPGRVICPTCQDRVRAGLLDLGRLWRRLGQALTPAATGAVERVTGNGEARLPVRPAVVELRAQIAHDVRWWCAYVADARGVTRHVTRSVTPDGTLDDPWHGGAWLSRHVDWIAGQVEAPALVEVVADHTRAARALVDLPADRARIPVGPCPQRDDDGARCAGQVTAHIPRDLDDPAMLRCDTCSAEWETHQWLRVGKRINDVINDSRRER